MTAVVTLPTEGGPQETRIFTLRGCHLLAMLARTPVAKEFRRWCLDVIEKYGDALPPPASAALSPVAEEASETRYLYGECLVRVAFAGGSAWFAACDVCAALELKFAGHLTLAGMPASWKRLVRLNTRRGMQPIWMIRLPAVHRLAANIRAVNADAFADWIEEIVSPDVAEARTARPECPGLPADAELDALGADMENARCRIRAIVEPLQQRLNAMESRIFEAMQRAAFGSAQASLCASGRPLIMQWSQQETLLKSLSPSSPAVGVWDDPIQNLKQYVRALKS